MIFQTLDNKNDCYGVFCDGELYFDSPEDLDLTRTWSYSSFLSDKAQEIDYAYLFSGGKSLNEACPEALRDDWSAVDKKLKAYMRSFCLARVSLDENCFFDLVPRQFLLDYCSMRNRISEHVFKTHERPDNYEFLVDLSMVLDKISQQRLNIDLSALRSKLHQSKTRRFKKKMTKIPPYIRYNLFGTKTGRLTTKKDTFPILTFDKDHRSILKPSNDWLVELDYNAAELRTMLALSGKEQPQVDIHEWNIKNIFGGNIGRDEAKTRIFAWLYGSEKEKNNLSNTDVQKILSETYRKKEIVRQNWTGTHVRTRFGRSIPCDSHHALSYIIQSVCVDLVLRRLIALDRILAPTSSRVGFTLHDSIVIDLCDADRHLLPRIIEEFSQTELGKFKVNVSAGKNFGEMKELKL